MLVKLNLKMLHLHICESWHTNRGRVPSDLKGYILTQSFLARNYVIRNLRQIQYLLALQEEHLYAEREVRWNNSYSSNWVCICPSLFKTNAVHRKRRFLFWEIKPLTPVLLTIPLPAAMNTLVSGTLFKFFRFDITCTFAQEVCHLGIKRKPKMANCLVLLIIQRHPTTIFRK